MSINLKIFNDNGILLPIEFKNLPFDPKRIFYIVGTPCNSTRGCHAHINTEQLLICLQGKILVRLHNGNVWKNHILNSHENIFVGKMVWDEQVYLTGNDILLSLCSTEYDEKDYIQDFEKFNELILSTKYLGSF